MLAENQITLEVVNDGEQGPQGATGEDGKSAYESAVDGGYQGTEQDFNEDLGTFSDAVNHFWTDEDGAHVTDITQEEYISDPENAGGNTLITSKGMTVRNGTTDLATFGSDMARVGEEEGSRTEIAPATFDIYSSTNKKAMGVSGDGGTDLIYRIVYRVRMDDSYLVNGINNYSRNFSVSGVNTGNGIKVIITSQIYHYYTLSGSRKGTELISDKVYTAEFVAGTSKTLTTTKLKGTTSPNSNTNTTIPITIEYNSTNNQITITKTNNTVFNTRRYLETYYCTAKIEIYTQIEAEVPLIEFQGRALLNESPIVSLGRMEIVNHEFSYSAISSGSTSGVKYALFEHSGYYPIGVVGFKTGNGSAVPIRFMLSSRSSGSCELSYYLRAVGGNVSAGSGTVDILWVKE